MKTRAILAALLLSPMAANAAFISQDLFSPSDDLLTLDTKTNKQWVDPWHWAGLTYEEVLAQLQLEPYRGFQIATYDDVVELGLNMGVRLDGELIEPEGRRNGVVQDHDPALLPIFQMIGRPVIRPATFNWEAGGYLAGPLDDYGYAYFSWTDDGGTREISALVKDYDGSSARPYGAWVYRSVPEPGTLTLLSVALLGLLFRRKHAS